MVKTPRTRHSKTSREPVTIDLEVDKVKSADNPAANPKESSDTAAAKPSASAKSDEPAKAQASTGAAGAKTSETHTADKKPTDKPGTSGEKKASDTKPAASSTDRKDDPAKGAAASGVAAGAAASGSSTGATSKSAPAAPAKTGGTGRSLLAGVAGGVIALALGAGAQVSGYLPVLSTQDAAQEQTSDPAEIEGLREQLSALSSEVEQLRTQTAEAAEASSGASSGVEAEEVEALNSRIEAVEQAVANLQEAVSSGEAGENAGLEALKARVQELETAASSPAGSGAGEADPAIQEALSALEERVSALPENAVSADQVEALQQELAALREAANAAQQAASGNSEQLQSVAGRLDELAQQVEAEDEGPKLALVVAASALKSAVERGTPFASELETFTAIAPDAPGLEPLQPYAEQGIPTREELAEAAPLVATRLAALENAAPPDAGIVDRLMSSAKSVVSVRPVGEVEGESISAIAARMEAAVLGGNYEKALAEYESLPPEAKERASAFAEKLRARQAADEILEDALSSALKPA